MGAQSFASTSPTATASSQGPGSAGMGSDCDVSPTASFNRVHFGGSSFERTIYEIDLKADEDKEPHSVGANVGTGVGASTAGGTETAAGVSNATATAAASIDSTSPTHSLSGRSISSSPTSRGRPTGRNMFAKPPGSASRCSRSPSPRSDISTSTFASNVSASSFTFGSDEVAMSTLAAAAATAAASVGIPASACRPGVRSAATPPIYTSAESTVSVESDSSASSGAPPSMPPLPPNVNQLTKKHEDMIRGVTGVAAAAVVATGTSNSKAVEDERADPVVAQASRSTLPWGGVLSGFACLSATEQASPSTDTAAGSQAPWRWGEPADLSSPSSHMSTLPGSRLPELDDEDVEEEKAAEPEEDCSFSQCPPVHRGTGGSDSVGVWASPTPSALTLERALAISRARAITPDLTPVAEELGEDSFFSDSETESEISSRASSVSGTGGARRSSRDPAALLAAAIEKAGQIAAIPPPSAGSPGKIGQPLSAVAEMPGEGAVSLPDSPVAPVATASHEGLRPFQGGGCASATSPIPSTAQRPGACEMGKGVDPVLPQSAGEVVADGMESSSDMEVESVSNTEDEKSVVASTTEVAVAVSYGNGMDVAREFKHQPGIVEDEALTTDDVPALVSPRTPTSGAVMSVAEQTPPGSPVSRRPSETAATKPPGFSLLSALSAFLGKKETPCSPSRGSEKNAATVATAVAVSDDPAVSSDLTKSTVSQAVSVRPEAIVEDPLKISRNDGVLEAPEHIEAGSTEKVEGGGDQLVSSLPPRSPCHDLPSLVLPSEENGELLG